MSLWTQLFITVIINRFFVLLQHFLPRNRSNFNDDFIVLFSYWLKHHPLFSAAPILLYCIQRYKISVFLLYGTLPSLQAGMVKSFCVYQRMKVKVTSTRRDLKRLCMHLILNIKVKRVLSTKNCNYPLNKTF